MKEFRKLKSLKFLYEINANGVIRNVKSKKILKPDTITGYARIHINNKSLSEKGISTVCVHHLVMDAWGTPKPGENYTIDHIDRNKLNNNIRNLRWCTQSEQNKNIEEIVVKKPVKGILSDGTVLTFDSSIDAARWITKNVKGFENTSIKSLASRIRSRKCVAKILWKK